MFCTSKEQETCEVEKRGCENCYYNASEKDVLDRVEKAIKFMVEDNYNPVFVRTIKDFICLYNQAKSKIEAKEMVHDYDIKMIDEVKGEYNKLFKELQQEKETSHYLQNRLDEADAKLIDEKQKIIEIRDKLEIADYYFTNDAVDDLNKILGEENE